MKTTLHTTRRAFLRTSALAGAGCAGCSVLAGCGDDDTDSPPGFTRDIALSRDDYPEIFDEGGLTTVSEEMSGYAHPIYLRNLGDGVVLALGAWCSHQGCSVNAIPSGYQCPCHGSLFDEEGNRLDGPATRDLIAFATEVETDQIIILAPEDDRLPEEDDPL